MIIVRVELHSARTGDVTELARATIDNIGGDRQHGNYRIRVWRGRSREALDQRHLQREGRVIGHARLREHVWNLVAKALTVTGYGERS